MVKMLTLVSGTMIGGFSVFQFGGAELVLTSTNISQNMSIGFVAHITDMLPWVDHIQITNISISGISLRLGNGVNYTLDCMSRLKPLHRFFYPVKDASCPLSEKSELGSSVNFVDSGKTMTRLILLCRTVFKFCDYIIQDLRELLNQLSG